MKKKFLSLALVLVLVFGCSAIAMAAKVVISPQTLIVDNEQVACEKYNIDGSNYFKLRDLAYILNGSDSQFAVGYDDAARTVTITKGEAYEPVGGELVIGLDKSSTAVPSSQKILINGEPNSALSVYNIGGNNYFKLRDLGDALGFIVDYEAATNCAFVQSIKTADSLDISVKKGEELGFDKTYFDGDLSISGNNGQVSFNMCKFAGNVTLNAKEGTKVMISNCYFAEGSKLYIKSGVREATLAYDNPKFLLDSEIPVISEDLGTVINFYGGDVNLNGKVYKPADSEYYYDEGAGIVPYSGQIVNYFIVSQIWEKGELKIYIVAQTE